MQGRHQQHQTGVEYIKDRRDVMHQQELVCGSGQKQTGYVERVVEQLDGEDGVTSNNVSNFHEQNFDDPNFNEHQNGQSPDKAHGYDNQITDVKESHKVDQDRLMILKKIQHLCKNEELLNEL